MVRKTHKGVVGKKPITAHNHDKIHIGPGVNFKELNLDEGPEIKEAAEALDKTPDV